MTDEIYIVFPSHRARHYGLRHLGIEKPQSYYSWSRDTGKGCYKITTEQLASLQSYRYLGGKKMFRLLRGPFDDLKKCWMYISAK